MARWHMERRTAEDYERARNELRRFLENDPTGADSAWAWQMLGHACYQTGDTLGEVHAFIERSQLSTVPFQDISNTANRLNRLLREHVLDIGNDVKHEFALRILAVLEKRQSEASADDLSRMSWLALSVAREDMAIAYAEAGLKLEPENYHCRKIASRLGLNI